jgi:hypothetical protein
MRWVPDFRRSHAPVVFALAAALAAITLAFGAHAEPAKSALKAASSESPDLHALLDPAALVDRILEHRTPQAELSAQRTRLNLQRVPSAAPKSVKPHPAHPAAPTPNR